MASKVCRYLRIARLSARAPYDRDVARPPRILLPGIYHLTAHGSDNRQLFVSDSERENFLARLAAICERFELALLSYVLMGNHYHALLRIPDARLSIALQRLHTEYSRHLNRMHGRSAHLFRAHPGTREIESDEHLVTAARYVARNPVRAGLVRDPLDWRWSSVAAHAGFERPRIPLTEIDLEAAFGGRDSWRREYLTQIRIPDEDELPRAA
jgi:putative transposase